MFEAPHWRPDDAPCWICPGLHFRICSWLQLLPLLLDFAVCCRYHLQTLSWAQVPRCLSGMLITCPDLVAHLLTTTAYSMATAVTWGEAREAGHG